MDASRIRKAENIFQQAVDLPLDARGALLDQSCQSDPELRRYVEALLAHHDSGMGEFLETPVFASRGGEALSAIPDQIGRYRILSVLGQGGMGVVYLAEQDVPRRTVALKTIHGGLLSAAARRRFENETAVLSRLQHPSIAQIYEAGTIDGEAGVMPFFAMEFVDGQPLTDYARRNALDTRERLALLIQLCAAVQYAHQRGVIHRDLKPVNILVDRSGQVKVLDFGVARATDSDVYATTLQTGVGQLIGTIAYMSPEQVCGDPRELDTRSDVYSLGVVSYELLADRAPYDLSRTAIPEAIGIIRDVDPPPLGSVHRACRGDVETIVLKALEKDRNRRYASAGELAADLQRYLTNQTILARPASTIYHLRKLAARHKGVAASVALLFVVLVGFSAWMSLLYARADRLRLAADRQAHRARQTQLFLEKMLSSIDPKVAMGKDTSLLRGILAEAAGKVGTDLAGQPEAQADIRATIGAAYLSVGLAAEAESQLRSALALRREALGERHEAVAATLRLLAECAAEQGDRQRAEDLARQALALRRQILGDDDPRVAEALRTLAWILSELHGDHSQAAALLRESLEITERTAGREAPAYAEGLHRLAVVLWRWQRHGEAEVAARETLALKRRLFGDDHPSVATAVDLLGQVLTSRKDLAAAEPLIRESIEMHRRLYGEMHPVFVTSLNSLSELLVARGDYEAAEPMARRCLDLIRQLRGEDSHETAMAWLNLAALLDKKGNYEEAEELYRVADERFRRVFPADHPYVHSPLTRLAELLDNTGQHESAEPLWRRLVTETRQAFPPSHTHYRLALMKAGGLGRCLLALHRCEDAEPFLVETYDGLRSTLGPQHKETIRCLKSLVQLYEECGPAGKADELRTVLESAGGDPLNPNAQARVNRGSSN